MEPTTTLRTIEIRTGGNWAVNRLDVSPSVDIDLKAAFLTATLAHMGGQLLQGWEICSYCEPYRWEGLTVIDLHTGKVLVGLDGQPVDFPLTDALEDHGYECDYCRAKNNDYRESKDFDEEFDEVLDFPQHKMGEWMKLAHPEVDSIYIPDMHTLMVRPPWNER